MREIRALGMDVGVDFHGRVHKGMARQLAKLLEGEGVLFIEGEHLHHICTGAKSDLTDFRTPSTYSTFGVRGHRASRFHSYCSWGTALLAT